MDATNYVRQLIDNGLRIDCHKTYLNKLLESNRDKFISLLSRRLISSGYFELDICETIILFHDLHCSKCGQHVNYKLNSGVLTAIEKECYEIKPYSVDIRVTSGKLLLTDNPKHGEEIIGHLSEHDSLGFLKGKMLESLKHAKENIMYFFVGSRSLSIYRKENMIHIGEDGYDYETNTEYPIIEGGELVGHISTGIWSVTAFDYETYLEIATRKYGSAGIEMVNETFSDQDALTIRVTPGIYRCTSYYNVLSNERGKPERIITMELLSII